VAAPTALLADSRSGGRGGLLPWALLVTGSVASLAANEAVAEPTATGRVIAAWPSFALIGSYELLMRQVRLVADAAPGKKRPMRHSSMVSHTTPATSQSSVRQQRGAASIQLAQAGSCSCRRGDGREPTGQATARFLPAGPLPASKVGKNAGVGSSSKLAWRAHSPPTSEPPDGISRPALARH